MTNPKAVYLAAGVLSLLLVTFGFESLAQDAPPLDHPLFNGPIHDAPTPSFDQEHVRLALRFEPESGRFFGVLTLRVRPVSDALDVLTLDAGPLDIYGIQIGSMDSPKLDAAFADTAGTIRISLDSLQTRDKPFEVQITYTGTPQTGMHFRKVDPSDTTYATHIWTDTTPGSQRFWLPLIDQPADRITSEIIATVPPSLSVLANGRLVQEMDTEDDMALFHYVQDQPHASRHIGLVVGHFQKLRDTIALSNGSSLNLDTWLPAYGLERAQNTFEDLPDIVNFFSDKLDFTYPWPAYTQVVHDGLLMDDPSYTGFNILSDRVLKDERALIDDTGRLDLATTTARQWAGHLLSAYYWSDSWLTESLSRYLGLLYLRERNGEAGYYSELARLKSRYLEEAVRYERPLVWDQWDTPISLMDDHSGTKGVWFFHTLHELVGDAAFWEIMRDFFRRKAFQSASTDDLQDSITNVTQQSFDRLLDRWVFSAGHPVARLNYQHDVIAESLYVAIEQVQEGWLVPSVYWDELTLETYSLTGPERRTASASRGELISIPMTIPPRYVLADPDHVYMAEWETEQAASAWINQLRYASNPLSQLEAVANLHAYADDPALLIGLQSALNSRPSPIVRAGIVQLIAALPPSDATKRTIVESYQDAAALVKCSVLRSLERFEDRTDLTNLAMQAAQSSGSYILQAQAVETLARIGAPDAAGIIESALITSSHRDIIRQTALRSLSYLEMSTRARVQKVLPYTRPTYSTEARIAAIDNLAELAKLGNQASMNALTALLKDHDPMIRNSVVRALGGSNLEEILVLLRDHASTEKDLVVLHDTLSEIREIEKRMGDASTS